MLVEPRQTNFDTFGIHTRADFNGTLHRFRQEVLKAPLPVLDCVRWLQDEEVKKCPRPMPWPFALVALCEAHTCVSLYSGACLAQLANKALLRFCGSAVLQFCSLELGIETCLPHFVLGRLEFPCHIPGQNDNSPLACRCPGRCIA